MANRTVSELRAFVPAKDYELSRQFYSDLGFTESWTSPELSVFRADGVSFLLQNFYVQEFADNFMMHLMVEDLDAWWEHLRGLNLAERYEGIRMKEPQDYPWGLREIHLIDPTGVLWHISQRPE